MTEVRGERRQKSPYVLTASMPSQLSVAGKAVPQVMQTGPGTAFAAAQTTACEHCSERVLDVGVIEPASGGGDKERTVRRHRGHACTFV